MKRDYWREKEANRSCLIMIMLVLMMIHFDWLFVKWGTPEQFETLWFIFISYCCCFPVHWCRYFTLLHQTFLCMVDYYALHFPPPSWTTIAFPPNPYYFQVCGRCDHEDRLLLCDGCDLGYHLECLDPPLTRVPIEEWFCPDCQALNATSNTAIEVCQVDGKDVTFISIY